MTTIERLLGVLNVERLILPAAKNAETVWVNKYGFSRMDDAQVWLSFFGLSFIAG